MPPPNFTGLTDAELRAMEGNERLNVEARIKVLRNIQILLDAAVMEMNQYSAVAGRLNQFPAPAAPVSSAPPPASTSPEVEENGARSFITPGETGTKQKSTAAASTTEATATSDAEVKEEEEEEQLLIQTMDGEGSNVGALSDEQNEIRRRRLEKFAKKDEEPKEEA
jgi:E3 ubiquitin-protein ligase synoviolin